MLCFSISSRTKPRHFRILVMSSLLVCPLNTRFCGGSTLSSFFLLSQSRRSPRCVNNFGFRALKTGALPVILGYSIEIFTMRTTYLPIDRHHWLDFFSWALIFHMKDVSLCVPLQVDDAPNPGRPFVLCLQICKSFFGVPLKLTSTRACKKLRDCNAFVSAGFIFMQSHRTRTSYQLNSHTDSRKRWSLLPSLQSSLRACK